MRASLKLSTVPAQLPSIYVFSYFPFGFEGRIWDLIVSVPDHCLSFYFTFQYLDGSTTVKFFPKFSKRKHIANSGIKSAKKYKHAINNH